MMFRRGLVRLLVLLLAALPVASIFAVPAHAATSRVAIIKSLTGTVQVKKSGGSKEFKAFAKMSLNEGDVLTTSANSSTVLQFSNGTSEDDRMSVSANSTLTFSKLSDRNGTRTKVSMFNGTAWVDVKSIVSKNDEFTLETPTAIMGVRGTHLLVSVDSSTGSTRLTVAAGVVTTTTAGTSEAHDVVPGDDALISKKEDQTGEITIAPADLELLMKQTDSSIVEAIVAASGEIVKENAEKIDQYFGDSGSQPADDLARKKSNVENLLGAIVDNAVKSGAITPERVAALVDEAQRQTGVTVDLTKRNIQLSDEEKKKQDEKRLKEEEENKKAQEVKKRLEEERKKQNDALMKKLEEERKKKEEAIKKAEEEKKKKAQEEYEKQLSDAEKKRFAESQKQLENNSPTPTPSVTNSSPEVQPPAMTDAERVAADKGKLVIGYASGDSADGVKNNVSLPTSGTNGTTITWTSNNSSVIAANGMVTRPAYLAENVTVILTATITKGSANTTKEFTLKVLKLQSSNADLSALTLSNGTINFSPSITTYNINVLNISSISITPTVADPRATVKVNGIVVSSGQSSHSITLSTDAITVINVLITAEDGVTTRQYVLNVQREVPAPAKLIANVSISEMQTFIFDPETAVYNLGSLDNSQHTLSFTILTDATPVVLNMEINGETVPHLIEGGVPFTLYVPAGTNEIKVIAMNNNEPAQSYLFTVFRASSSNTELSWIDVTDAVYSNRHYVVFSPSYEDKWVAYVPNNIDLANLRIFLMDPDAKIVMGSEEYKSGDLVPVEFNFEEELDYALIEFKVKASDGTESALYGLKVNRIPEGLGNSTELDRIELIDRWEPYYSLYPDELNRLKTTVSMQQDELIINPIFLSELGYYPFVHIWVGDDPESWIDYYYGEDTYGYRIPLASSGDTEVHIQLTSFDMTVEREYVLIIHKSDAPLGMTVLPISVTDGVQVSWNLLQGGLTCGDGICVWNYRYAAIIDSVDEITELKLKFAFDDDAHDIWAESGPLSEEGEITINLSSPQSSDYDPYTYETLEYYTSSGERVNVKLIIVRNNFTPDDEYMGLDDIDVSNGEGEYLPYFRISDTKLVATYDSSMDYVYIDPYPSFYYSFADVLINGSSVEKTYMYDYKVPLSMGWNEITIRVWEPSKTYPKDYMFTVWRGDVLPAGLNLTDIEVEEGITSVRSTIVNQGWAIETGPDTEFVDILPKFDDDLTSYELWMYDYESESYELKKLESNQISLNGDVTEVVLVAEAADGRKAVYFVSINRGLPQLMYLEVHDQWWNEIGYKSNFTDNLIEFSVTNGLEQILYINFNISHWNSIVKIYGEESYSIEYHGAEQTIPIVVQSPAGTITEYTLKLIPVSQFGNADVQNMSLLDLNGVELESFNFDPVIHDYSLELGYEVNELTLQVTAVYERAEVRLYRRSENGNWEDLPALVLDSRIREYNLNLQNYDNYRVEVTRGEDVKVYYLTINKDIGTA